MWSSRAAGLHFLILGEAGSVFGGEGEAPGRRGRPGCHYATHDRLLRFLGRRGGQRRLWGGPEQLRGETYLLPTALAYLTYYFAGPDLPASGPCTEASRPEAVVLPGKGGGGPSKKGGRG